jgi:ferrous iron transport protein A
MHDMVPDVASAPPAVQAAGRLARLSTARPGDRGAILEVRVGSRGESAQVDRGVDVDELQRRLLEFGFVEGARVEVLHEGAIRHDPIAVKLDDMRVALRRRDAQDIWVLLDDR